MGLGLGGGFLWKSQIQDARFIIFKYQMRMAYELDVADIKATYGPADDARMSYQSLLKSEPQWPEALERYAWFLNSQSEAFRVSGSPAKAAEDAQECLTIAQRFYDLDKSQRRAQRVLKIAHDQLGDCLLQSGASPRDVRVFEHRQRSLELAETILQAAPKSAQAARETLDSISRIGDLMLERGEQSDMETAIQHFSRALEITEKLSAANPGSAKHVFEVIASHQRLASLCQQHGDKVGEEKHARASYDLLHELVAKGEDLEPTLQRAHEELHARFGK